MHNTPQQNEAFRKAWDASNLFWKMQQKAFEANPEAYKAQYQKKKEVAKNV